MKARRPLVCLQEENWEKRKREEDSSQKTDIFCAILYYFIDDFIWCLFNCLPPKSCKILRNHPADTEQL